MNIYLHSDLQTERYFLKTVKSCSGHLKTSKSVKNRKSKNFTIPIFSSHTEHRKKQKNVEYLLKKQMHYERFLSTAINFHISLHSTASSL